MRRARLVCGAKVLWKVMAEGGGKSTVLDNSNGFFSPAAGGRGGGRTRIRDRKTIILAKEANELRVDEKKSRSGKTPQKRREGGGSQISHRN